MIITYEEKLLKIGKEHVIHSRFIGYIKCSGFWSLHYDNTFLVELVHQKNFKAKIYFTKIDNFTVN